MNKSLFQQTSDSNKKPFYLLKITDYDRNGKPCEVREHAYKSRKKCINFMMMDINDFKENHTVYSQEERFYDDVFKYIRIATNCCDIVTVWEITELYFDD